jgi:hypothetical protein
MALCKHSGETHFWGYILEKLTFYSKKLQFGFELIDKFEIKQFLGLLRTLEYPQCWIF